jgi:outer membrane protein TolC
MRRHIIFALALVLLHTASFAQSNTLSLDEAIAQGLSNSYQLEIAGLQSDIAKNNNTNEASGMYPRVSFNLNSANAYNNSISPNPFALNAPSVNGGVVANLDATWTLFNGYKVRISKARLEMLQNQANTNFSLTMENTVRAIMLAYYNTLIQQEQVGVLSEVMALSRDKFNYQKTRRELGTGLTFDLLQAEQAYLNDSTNYLIQLNALENAKRNLMLSMSQSYTDLADLQLSTKLDEPKMVEALETLRDQMINQNQSLLQLDNAGKLAQIESQFQASNRYPTLNMSTGLNEGPSLLYSDFVVPSTGEKLGFGTGNTFNAYINFNFTYPIYNGGVVRRGMANAKIQEDIVSLQKQDLTQQLNVQLDNAYANYLNQQQVLSLTIERSANAIENLRISEERYKGGLINIFDYRAVQVAYISAEQARLSALFNLRNIEVELLRISGMLLGKE